MIRRRAASLAVMFVLLVLAWFVAAALAHAALAIWPLR